MTLHELAGQPAPVSLLENIPRLVSAYYTQQPDPENPSHRIGFGTSGHRGSSLDSSFNEAHILAVAQAICEVRAAKGTTGPLFLGMDTHALSEPALRSAVEVFAANGVEVHIQQGLGYTPTPVISHAILCYNQEHSTGKADGVIITPSHNPPRDGGIKYNPPTGGPAGTELTQKIETRANALLATKLSGVKRLPFERAFKAATTHHHDYVHPYINDLDSAIDMDAIAASGLKLGVDPMGGAGIAFWEPLAERYKLNLNVVNPRVDPTFAFMTVDKDGKIRMDCSSPSAMASLIALKDRFDIAFGNDPDYDRHGIVTPSGLMNPNHYLAVAIQYLLQHRPHWPRHAAVGKTLVSSSMIDRVANAHGRALTEVPVGFKWFVPGLLSSDLVFGGEESAGASFLRRDGRVWTTDKDGILLNLLAAELTAVTGRSPDLHYRALEETFGSPVYERIDAPATTEQKSILKTLSPSMISANTLAGEPILERLTHASGNGAAIGGLKVVTENGWFAARPSGTEAIYKIYAESFRGREHLTTIQHEAQEIVATVLNTKGD